MLLNWSFRFHFIVRRKHICCCCLQAKLDCAIIWRISFYINNESIHRSLFRCSVLLVELVFQRGNVFSYHFGKVQQQNG